MAMANSSTRFEPEPVAQPAEAGMKTARLTRYPIATASSESGRTWNWRPMVGRATLTMVMSMMFMNMAATKTTLTLIFGLMRIRSMARLCWRWNDVTNTRGRPDIPGHRSERGRSGPLCGDEAEPDLATGVVAVGVDQDDTLRGAEQQVSAQDGEW